MHTGDFPAKKNPTKIGSNALYYDIKVEYLALLKTLLEITPRKIFTVIPFITFYVKYLELLLYSTHTSQNWSGVQCLLDRLRQHQSSRKESQRFLHEGLLV